MAIEFMCDTCGTTFSRFTSMQRRCGRCQYNKMMALRTNSRAKPVKRYGKKTLEWLAERKQWIKDNPPDFAGYWYCYLRTTEACPGALQIDQLTIDHVIPRSKHKPTELRPACMFCNNDKGSQDLKLYLSTHPRIK